MKYTAENVTVYPISKAKINAHVMEKIPHEHSDRLDVTFSWAIVKSPKLAIINDEFVGTDITDNKIVLDVYRTTLRPDGSESFSMMPEYQITFTTDEIEPYLDKPVTLAEFTKERRGYNSRIEQNERSWVRFFNQK